MSQAAEGIFSARDYSFAIVVSRFNEFITKRLLEGALDCLKQHDAHNERVTVVYCPGAFEVPQLAQHLAESKQYHAIICLGCVIRGETPHFEYVASAAAHGIERVAQHTGIPMSFGILTTDTPEQAMERAGGKVGNKGWDAAMSAIEMAEIFQTFGAEERLSL